MASFILQNINASIGISIFSYANFTESKPHKFYSIHEEADLEFIKSNVSKLHFIYNETDHWAPPEQADLIKAQVPNSQVDILQGVDHAFCVYEKDNKIIGQWLVQYIDDLSLS